MLDRKKTNKNHFKCYIFLCLVPYPEDFKFTRFDCMSLALVISNENNVKLACLQSFEEKPFICHKKKVLEKMAA